MIGLMHHPDMRRAATAFPAWPPALRLPPAGVWTVCAVLAVGFVAPRDAGAQRRGSGSIAGRIVDQVTREPVGGAHVLLVGTRVAALTDSTGRFGMQSLPNGEVTFQVRALGYRMGRWQITLPIGMTAERVFEMTPQNIALDTLVVEAPRDRNWRGADAFEMRRRRGIGHFITPEIIAERQANVLNDLLQTVPGVLTSCGGGSCQVQMMASGANCRPEFFLDGFPATNAVGWDFPVRTVRAVEIYRSLFEVPPEFQRSNLRCGVIAIWSR
jgi:hypothetical protein